MTVTLSFTSLAPLVRGMLRNLFVEVDSSLFVGTLNSTQLLELVRVLEDEGCQGVVAVHSRKAALGVRIKQLGERDRRVVTVDGVQLMQRPYKSTGYR